MSFKVTRVIDGDTFNVFPGWRAEGRTGLRVRIAGFDAPEIGALGGEAARRRLESLLLEHEVSLYTKSVDMYGRLIAEVHLNGKDVKEYLGA